MSPVRAVMAWRAPRPPSAPGGRPPAGLADASEDHEARAERQLRAFVDAALDFPADVDCEVVKGNAVNALLTAARDAQLLVVGEPRPGRLNNVRASLVAPQVVLKARCPVVVMPAATALAGDARPSGPVAVAHARLGDQVPRPARLGLELAAQLREVDAQVARVGVLGRAAHRGQQRVAR